MLTTIPFSGFYNSIHDGELDSVLKRMFADNSGDPYGGIVSRASFDCDWRAVYIKYAKMYCENFAEHFEIKLKFESLNSPREYNFTTDRIFATISRAEFRRLYKARDHLALVDLAREKFSSRSGFISHYPAAYGLWGPIDSWDHNKIGTLIESTVGDFDDFELMGDANCNGDLDNMIGAAIPDAQRYWRITDYLRSRAERHGN